jgi:hypothetical protein
MRRNPLSLASGTTRAASRFATFIVGSLFLHAPFVAGHPAWGPAPGELTPATFARVVPPVLAQGFVLTFAVGLAWAGPWFRTRDTRWPIAFGANALALVAALWLTRRFSGTAPSAALCWNLLWGFASLGNGFGWLARRETRFRSRIGVGLFAFVIAWGLFLVGATRVVPELDDHDLEVIGTGRGLLSRGEPMLLTDRGTVYYFAHPPLLHVQTAAAFLVQGRYSSLGPYDRISRTAAAVVDRPGSERVLPLLIEEIYRRFHERPEKLAARSVNIFLAALTVGLLASWSARLSGSSWIGLLAAAAYVGPEVFVRSSYGGYFAIDGLMTLLMLTSWAQWQRRPGFESLLATGSAGSFAALADHKLLLIPLGLSLAELIAPSRPGGRLRVFGNPLGWGFVAGMMAFALWGWWINPAAFWRDHVRTHLIDRLTHHNPLGYGGYPSLAGLWFEFMENTGYLTLPLMAIGLGVSLARGWCRLCLGRRREETRERHSNGSGRIETMVRGWFVWLVLSGIVWSLVDWRMTKHLMPALVTFPPLVALTWRLHPRWRIVIAVTLAILTAFNALAIAGLFRDFTSVKPSPAW